MSEPTQDEGAPLSEAAQKAMEMAEARAEERERNPQPEPSAEELAELEDAFTLESP